MTVVPRNADVSEYAKVTNAIPSLSRERWTRYSREASAQLSLSVFGNASELSWDLRKLSLMVFYFGNYDRSLRLRVWIGLTFLSMTIATFFYGCFAYECLRVVSWLVQRE